MRAHLASSLHTFPRSRRTTRTSRLHHVYQLWYLTLITIRSGIGQHPVKEFAVVPEDYFISTVNPTIKLILLT
ncbi:MAG TPA: hypothetical protein VED37_11890 [Ktedonobacteraceae bacterium]|nr:hypothetical protein [Ktedonobacteraceae bacterium]